MALVSSSTRFPFSMRFIRRSRSVKQGSSRDLGSRILREDWVADFGGWVMSFAWFCLVLWGFWGHFCLIIHS